MAKGKKENSASLARIVRSLEVTIDGETIRVPVGKEENRIASMVSAAQMRDLIQSQMKKYKEGEIQLTPKELKDLAEALHTVAKFSGEVYASEDDIAQDGEDTKKEDPIPVEAVDFSKIATNKPAEPANDNTAG